MIKEKKRNIFIPISILLVIIVIALIVFILNDKQLVNKKIKETVVSTKTVEEQSDLKTAISKVYNAVVYIEVKSNSRMGTQVSSGSGFVYKKDSKNAYIMTNNHVVEGANNVTITYSDGKETEASLVGADEFTDVAILKVDVKTIKDVVTLGNSDNAELGDTVFTVGAPLGKEYMGTITKGIVSGTSRMVSIKLNSGNYLMEAIQTDATINSGNSGGPLCNIKGEVIGITSSKLVGDGIEGMGFSIPISTVNSIIEKLEKGETIERPYVGVQLSDVANADALRYYYNINISKNVTYGALLTYIEPNKPADKSGLSVGDVVIDIDGEKITDSAKFRYVLYKHNVGDTVKVKYYHGDNEKTTTIKLTEKIN